MNQDIETWGHTASLENGPSPSDFTHASDCECSECYADMMEAHQQYDMEMQQVPEAERPTFEDWLVAEPIDTEFCPEHQQDVRVEGYGSTNGPDPYSVCFLVCGHAVWNLGDENLVYATDSRRLKKFNDTLGPDGQPISDEERKVELENHFGWSW